MNKQTKKKKKSYTGALAAHQKPRHTDWTLIILLQCKYKSKKYNFQTEQGHIFPSTQTTTFFISERERKYLESTNKQNQKKKKTKERKENQNERKERKEKPKERKEERPCVCLNIISRSSLIPLCLSSPL